MNDQRSVKRIETVNGSLLPFCRVHFFKNVFQNSNHSNAVEAAQHYNTSTLGEYRVGPRVEIVESEQKYFQILDSI